MIYVSGQDVSIDIVFDIIQVDITGFYNNIDQDIMPLSLYNEVITEICLRNRPEPDYNLNVIKYSLECIH